VVHRLLDDRGIKSTRVSAVGLADTQPLAENTTPDGRAVNRRVEIKVEIPTGN
jgi:chemotaxis protein MotB